VSGLVGKRVRAAVPGLGEENGAACGGGGRAPARPHSAASAVGRGQRPPAEASPSGGARRRAAVPRAGRHRLFGRHSTVDSELARTGGIRLSN
jgi:hypothetical protein